MLNAPILPEEIPYIEIPPKSPLTASDLATSLVKYQFPDEHEDKKKIIVAKAEDELPALTQVSPKSVKSLPVSHIGLSREMSSEMPEFTVTCAFSLESYGGELYGLIKKILKSKEPILYVDINDNSELTAFALVEMLANCKPANPITIIVAKAEHGRPTLIQAAREGVVLLPLLSLPIPPSTEVTYRRGFQLL